MGGFEDCMLLRAQSHVPELRLLCNYSVLRGSLLLDTFSLNTINVGFAVDLNMQ